jgi:putative aminopeptidase FrvX
MPTTANVNVDLLRRLCQTPGVPGREERVRSLIAKEVEGLFDESRVDAMGNLICRRAPRAGRKKSPRGRAPAAKERPTRVLLLCHMDQIGFYVRHIDERGYLRVVNAGGFDTRNLFSRRMTVVTDSGDLPAVMNPGGRPVHIATEEDKKKIPDVKELIIDTGLPVEQVKRRVKVGDYAVYAEPFVEMGEKCVSQAMDNRVACWLGIESVRRLEDSGQGHACELFVAFTTQEEVGLRGARTSSHIVACDIGIGIDVTLSCDTPGVPTDESVTEQGKGFGLHIMDSSFISDHQLIAEIESVAKQQKIPYQRTILMRGGQDGAAAQQTAAGARAAGIVVGTRYIHTTTEMIDKRDLAAARDVLAAWIPTVA